MRYITYAATILLSVCLPTLSHAQNMDWIDELNTSTNTTYEVLPDYRNNLILDGETNTVKYFIEMVRYSDLEKERLPAIVNKVEQAIDAHKGVFKSDYSQKTIEISSVNNGMEEDLVRIRERNVNEPEFTYLDGKPVQIKSTYDTVRVVDHKYIDQNRETVVVKVVYTFIYKNLMYHKDNLNTADINQDIEKKSRLIKAMDRSNQYMLIANIGIASNTLIPISPSFDATFGKRIGRGSTFIGLNASGNISFINDHFVTLSSLALEAGGVRKNKNNIYKSKASVLVGVQQFSIYKEELSKVDFNTANYMFYWGLNFPIVNGLSIKFTAASDFKKSSRYTNFGVGFHYTF